ncbi:preprotein translocase subunit YajC [Dorea acetigenes]|uniref:Preprotein translocase subunit YajC n=1 Tax=Dorea acetigenes TaxID=2981787 RepID=A0ABT2RMX0_9FIRM|nr:preprotein translocase subunit YajC [Dorea acetigenes]MCB6414612.1 preprotein translocase subunit YajC [Faecalimonas umbilicata]MCU6686698.1 preprotein translocase subunit YajC [Dorea acetigenes]SCJ07132.1 preprotein translocase subunit YajC [uncultured Clostridium sp.]
MFALAAANTTGSLFTMILIYAVIIGGFWFLLMRPQKKEQKRVAAMIAEMEVGDTVLTTSGFYGVIIDITEDDVIVEFGSNKNCRIPMQKTAIAQVEKAGAAE